ncbi:MAG: tryptophan synthase subunit alpha [Burkholderiales bacterium]|nr:tryptophan synthase subunit alpha [Burkholderiales bacterium]
MRGSSRRPCRTTRSCSSICPGVGTRTWRRWPSATHVRVRYHFRPAGEPAKRDESARCSRKWCLTLFQARKAKILSDFASNRIDSTFARLKAAGRTALIPYVTAGDPSLAATLPIMDALANAGADVIELGVPFSDPMADGPVIQRASERALAQHVTLADVLDVVARFRRGNAATPVVLMGYANPIEAMTVEAFAQRAQAAGVDGVIVVDYPPEEAGEFAKLMESCGIALIFLLAPTTPEPRIAQVARLARGFVYYVSLKGVTGASHLDISEVARKLGEIRRHVKLPVGVGFGIRDAQSAQAIARHADAVVIGTRIIQEIESGPAAEAASRAGAWLGSIRTALDHPR